MMKKRVLTNQPAMDLMDSFQQKSGKVGGAASESRMATERDKNPLKLDARLSDADREEKVRSYLKIKKKKTQGQSWEATTYKYCVTVPR